MDFLLGQKNVDGPTAMEGVCGYTWKRICQYMAVSVLWSVAILAKVASEEAC